MPSRGQMIEAASAYADELGWEPYEIEDTGPTVVMLLRAPGASEQMVDAPLSKLRKALKDLGGPEDQDGETKEYDLPENVEAGPTDEEVIEYIAKGLAISEGAARELLAYNENDPGWLKAANEAEATDEPAEATAGAQPEALATERTEGTLTDMSYDPEWAERCEQGPSVKELHRALERVGDTGPDGIPRPEQLIPEEEDLMPGGKIVARRDGEVMRFGFAIRPQVKAALEASGWSFTHVVAAARGDSTVAIERSGRVTIQNVNGRLIKSAGGMLTVSKGNVSFQVKSISVDYAKAGWHIV